MEIDDQKCGEKVASGFSPDKPGPFSKWLKEGDKDGRLEVKVLVRGSADSHSRPKTVRATVRGNLIEILLISGPRPDDELPLLCHWHVPYRFVIDGIQTRNYLLIFASEEDGFYRARNSVWVLEPD